MFNEMYPKNPVSDLQAKGYEIALMDLTAKELDAGCKRVLRTWGYTSMPPPAFIRECVADELREEMSRRPPIREAPPPKLTEAEALEMVEEMEAARKQMHASLATVAATMDRGLKKVYREHLVIATRERVAKLNEQKKLIEEKYGKGKIVRVRDSAPPQDNQGNGGAK